MTERFGINNFTRTVFAYVLGGDWSDTFAAAKPKGPAAVPYRQLPCRGIRGASPGIMI
jgi:hypothetical protein